jgi:hypothetical protein
VFESPLSPFFLLIFLIFLSLNFSVIVLTNLVSPFEANILSGDNGIQLRGSIRLDNLAVHNRLVGGDKMVCSGSLVEARTGILTQVHEGTIRGTLYPRPDP